MSHPRDLLERKCFPEYYKSLHSGGKLQENATRIVHLLFFGPKAVADGAELVRVFTDLKVYVLTFESVGKYKRALAEKFLTSVQTINIYSYYVYPRMEEKLSRIEDVICDCFPEPLQTIRKSLPSAEFYVETLEMFYTEIGSLLIVSQGDEKFYLHAFEEEPMVLRIIHNAQARLAPSS